MIGVVLAITVKVLLTVQPLESSAMTVMISSFFTVKLLVDVVVETVATKKADVEA